MGTGNRKDHDVFQERKLLFPGQQLSLYLARKVGYPATAIAGESISEKGNLSHPRLDRNHI